MESYLEFIKDYNNNLDTSDTDIILKAIEFQLSHATYSLSETVLRTYSSSISNIQGDNNFFEDEILNILYDFLILHH